MLAQFIINGIIIGVIYAIIALGFALVYNTTKIFHIAYAVLYMVSGYFLFSFFNLLGWSYWLAAVLAVLITVVVSVIFDVLVYTPLIKRNANLNVLLISSLGIMIITLNLIALFYGNETKIIHNEIAKSININNIIITYPQLYQLGISFLLIVMFFIILKYTKLGIFIRAIKNDEELAKVQGVDIERFRVMLFGLSGFFAAVAGVLTAQDIGIDPYIGMPMLLNAVVALIIGGIGSFYAPVLGGLILGILQALVIWKFSANWQEAITFVLLILFLVFRPQGILGKKIRQV